MITCKTLEEIVLTITEEHAKENKQIKNKLDRIKNEYNIKLKNYKERKKSHNKIDQKHRDMVIMKENEI